MNQDYTEDDELDELKVSHFILFILFIFFSVILVQKRIAFTFSEMRNLLSEISLEVRRQMGTLFEYIVPDTI